MKFSNWIWIYRNVEHGQWKNCLFVLHVRHTAIIFGLGLGSWISRQWKEDWYAVVLALWLTPSGWPKRRFYVRSGGFSNVRLRRRRDRDRRARA